MSAIHFILGNESSDLDSIVSSIVVAKYAKELFDDSDNTNTKYVAVLVTSKDMFFFKKYCSYVVEGIMEVDLTDTSALFFVQDFVKEVRNCALINVSLVDGSQIPPFLRLFDCQFQSFNVIDHHHSDPNACYLGNCVFVHPCASNCTNVFRLLWEKIFRKEASSTTIRRSVFFYQSSTKKQFWTHPGWFPGLLKNRKGHTGKILLGLLCTIIVDSLGMNMDSSDKVTIHDIKASLSILQYLRVGRFISLHQEENDEIQLFDFVRKNHSLLFGTILDHLRENAAMSGTASLVPPQLMLQLDYKDYLYECRDDQGDSFFSYGIASIPCSLQRFISDCGFGKETPAFEDFSSNLATYFMSKATLMPNYSFLFVITCQSEGETPTSTPYTVKNNFPGARQLSFCVPVDKFGTPSLSIGDEEPSPGAFLTSFEIWFPSLISNLELEFLSAQVADSVAVISFSQGKYKMSRKAIQPIIHTSLGTRDDTHRSVD